MPSDPEVPAGPIATIDLNVLGLNLAEVRRRAPGHVVIPSVKANAYGHGVVPVTRKLLREGVFGVATGSHRDVSALRRAGCSGRIIWFGSASDADIGFILRNEVVPTVASLDVAEAIGRASSRPVAVFVKIDAGFGRLGVPSREAVRFVLALGRVRNIVVEGVYTHLPHRTEVGRQWADEGAARFVDLIGALARAGMEIPVTQMASSSALLRSDPLVDSCTAVSPGHVLYGLVGSDDSRRGFAAVLRRIETSLIHVARHPARRRMGVDGKQWLSRGSVTGVASIGSAHGYLIGDSAYALVEGARCPVKSVSMEYSVLALPITNTPRVGSPVVLLGEDRDESIALEALSAWTGRTPLEVVVGLSDRVDYSYVG
jgi:alanine racemase